MESGGFVPEERDFRQIEPPASRTLGLSHFQSCQASDLPLIHDPKYLLLSKKDLMVAFCFFRLKRIVYYF